MLHHQQTRCRGHAASVLHAGSHLFGEGSSAHLSTRGAPFLFGLMLDHPMALAWQVNGLTRFYPRGHYSGEIRLAVGARRDGMTNDLIWAATPLDGFSRMIGWASWLVAACVAQASRFLLARKPIRGGRQMTVVTVFGQSARQLLDLFFELFYLLFQRQQFCHLGLESGIFFAQPLQFFFLRHSPTLTGFHWFGKSLGVLNSYPFSYSKQLSYRVLHYILQYSKRGKRRFNKITNVTGRHVSPLLLLRR